MFRRYFLMQIAKYKNLFKELSQFSGNKIPMDIHSVQLFANFKNIQ